MRKSTLRCTVKMLSLSQALNFKSQGKKIFKRKERTQSALIKYKEIFFKKKKIAIKTLGNLLKCGELRIQLMEPKDLIKERKSPC